MPKPLTIWTYDWVPGGKSGPRGFVRDVRLRWACEEAGLAYEVKSVPFKDRGVEHFARQPFAQIPFLDDDGVTLFESGACLLHLARKSETLMPRDPAGAADALQWTISGLNSIEMVTVPWWYISITSEGTNPLEDWLHSRLTHLDGVLAQREWLAAGRFTVADLLMADILRVPRLAAAHDHKALHAYVERVCSRPAFIKARDDQMAHFAAADGPA